MKNNFSDEVNQGLSQENKSLPSKFFYDKRGDDLFVKIMNLPEYYLTNAEFDIFRNQTDELINSLQVDPNAYFELIELGAGNGHKTKQLLNALLENNFDFAYVPIDISKNALSLLEHSLSEDLPKLVVNAQHGDYFGVLDNIKSSEIPKVVLFLGSNIGNMEDDKAISFMAHLDESLNEKDKVVLGVDLIKPKEIVLPAYNDPQGITRDFNLNLLRRINEELGGDFNLNQFEHTPDYSEESGIACSYLTSTIDQKVSIESLSKDFYFKKGERIYMEISRKYNDEVLNGILENTQLEVISKLVDAKGYFADYVLEKKNH